MRRAVLGAAVAIAACAVAAPAAEATFPGANGMLVMSYIHWDQYGNSTGPQLWTSNPDGTGGGQLTTNGGQDASWSPDGKQIAYVDGNWHLALIGADGSNQRELLVHPPYQYTGDSAGTHPDYPSWLPDGQHILYELDAEATGGPLFESDLTGAVQTPVAAGMAVNEPSLSPDGRQVAYVDMQQDAFHVMNIDGSNDHAVAPIPANYRGDRPSWSPDGKQLLLSIFYHSCCDPSTSFVYEVRPSGAQLHQVANGVNAVWSPDGQKIHYQGVSVSGPAAWIANADGTQPTPAGGGNDEFTVDWQPLPTG